MVRHMLKTVTQNYNPMTGNLSSIPTTFIESDFSHMEKLTGKLKTDPGLIGTAKDGWDHFAGGPL